MPSRWRFFSACEKGEGIPDSPAGQIGIILKGRIASENTKTYIEQSGNVYIPHWASDLSDELGVFFGEIEENGTPVIFKTQPVENDVATFYGQVAMEAGTYAVHAFYPAAAFERVYQNQRLGLNLRTTQYPVAGSFDPDCDILIAAGTTVDVEGEGNIELDSLEFSRIMAVLRVNLVTADGAAIAAGQRVKQLKMVVGGVDDNFTLAGRVSVETDGSIYSWTIKSKEVAAEYGNEAHNAGESIQIGAEGGLNAAYLVVNPTSIPAGSRLTFIIKTENDQFVRTVTTPDMIFEAGKVTSINLTVRDRDIIEDVSYAGDWAIGNVDGTVLAGQWAGGNNLPGILTTFDDGTILLPSGKTKDDVKVTLTKMSEGDYSGMYTIQQSDGYYLCAASNSGNQLRAQETATIDCYWDITQIDGTWSVVAAKSTNRNVMQYNPNNNNPIFSCYASASQQEVVLFPLDNVMVNTAPTITSAPVRVGPAAASDVDLGVAFNAYVSSVALSIFDDEACASDFTGTWLFVSYDGGVVKYTVSANDTGQDRTAYIKVVASNQEGISVEAVVKFEQTAEPSGSVTDELTYELIGVTGTIYSSTTGIQSNSPALYSAQSAGGNQSIQLRSDNNNSGIVTTVSGGKLTKVAVTWNSNSASGRTLNIYGKTSSYGAPSDLYSSSTQGTLFGTIVYGTSTEVEVTGDYTYLGMRSNSGALYLDKIEITWE